MTDKKPVKRGVLSGLMGLFGDEEGGAETPNSAEPEVAGPARNAATPPEGPPPGEVVREAYEPGWYRISAAMPSSAGDDDYEDEPQPGPVMAEPVVEYPVVEAPVVEEPVVEEPVVQEPVVE